MNRPAVKELLQDITASVPPSISLWAVSLNPRLPTGKLFLEGTHSTAKEFTQNLCFADAKQPRRILKLRILAADILTRILKKQIPAHWTFSLLLQACEYPNWDR